MIIGDFNFCYIDTSNLTKRYLQDKNYNQIVKEPTHLEGNLLDHAYIKDTKQVHSYTADVHSKYYSDHKGVAVVVDKLQTAVEHSHTITPSHTT